MLSRIPRRAINSYHRGRTRCSSYSRSRVLDQGQHVTQEMPYVKQKEEEKTDYLITPTTTNNYLIDTTKLTVGALAGTGLAAAGTIAMGYFGDPMMTFFGGVGLSLVSVVGLGLTKPEKITEENQHIKTHNSVGRILLGTTFVISQGMSIAPMLHGLSVFNSSVIPVAGLMTMGTVAGMSSWALTKPEGELLKWGPALHVGLWGLVFTGLGSIFLGSTSGGLVLHTVSCLGGVGLFSALSAYDVHKTIDEFKLGKADHLVHSTNFYLNSINLFIRYAEILMYFKKFTDD